ncbi:glycosyltransferase family 1 protein [Marinovum algicola]|jgi:glycosyltransferase involved in cell wall biosynthesis|uniref:glycosyltransferase family 4 protein n=1 Tax=Alphaproteobacteria TaxID=28211 RepID=UPI0032EEBD31
MKLGVDISWMVGQYRGMGRFGRQLIAPVSDQVVALAPAGVTTSDWSCVSRGRGLFPWWEQVELPRLCRSEQLDYLLCPYNTGPIRPLGSTRVIAVIHDLIFMEPWSALPPSRSPYQLLGRLYRRSVVPAFAQRADTIVTVSHYSKSRLVEAFGFEETDIHVIPNAISDVWFQAPVPLEQRSPYLFTVAGEQPSKNVPRLLQAFARSRLWDKEGAKLQIAGIKQARHADFIAQCRELGIEEYVSFVGFVTDEELMELYRSARGFVFASTFEGFGIPLLEAMASGTPVASSNTTSMPEVVGSDALLFNPFDIDKIAAALRQVWACDDACAARALAGIARARVFSRSAVAVQIATFWNQLT